MEHNPIPLNVINDRLKLVFQLFINQVKYQSHMPDKIYKIMEIVFLIYTKYRDRILSLS